MYVKERQRGEREGERPDGRYFRRRAGFRRDGNKDEHDADRVTND